MIFDKFSLPMKILIKQATVVCPDSVHHLLQKDILIVDGKITSIEDAIDEDNAIMIANEKLFVSIGWLEVMADFADPGFEHRETIETGAQAAVNGGFTDVMILPNTKPAASTKAQIEYIVQKSKGLPINIHPIGSITKNCEGEELAEMYDMTESGAVAFSDGTQSIKQENILIKALQYHLATGKTVIQLPASAQFNEHGLMSEGIQSTRLGLPGMPAIAEELMIVRDIEIAKYTDGRLHISGISTKKGLEIALQAVVENDNLSFSVVPQQLWFTDEQLNSYDTNFKLLPPLRTESDRAFLLEKAKEGKIKCFTSLHLPAHNDEKDCEFEYAAFGNIGLETLFSALFTAGISVENIIEALTVNGRNVFGLPIPILEENSEACLTLFTTAGNKKYDAKKAASLSANSAFDGVELKGKVLGIINKGQFFDAI